MTRALFSATPFRFLPAIVLLSTTLPATVLATPPVAPASAPAPAPASPGAASPIAPMTTHGERLSALPPKTVEQCVEQSSKLSGKSVKMTGTVKAVCQQKGCWFALQGKDGTLVRVTSLGYKFFVPTNSAGKTATVEGLFEERTLETEMAQHYENDAVVGTGKAPRTITSPVKEYTLAATAVELK